MTARTQGKQLTSKAKRPAQKGREELSADRRMELHGLRMGLSGAREKAIGQMGRHGGAVLDESSPSETRCRVGTKAFVRITPTCQVPTLNVRGAGATWDQAFDEARRTK